jgi:hypothetical protein
MPYEQFDRFAVRMQPLSVRANKQQIEKDHVSPDDEPRPLPSEALDIMGETIQRVRAARRAERPVMISFGAHAIKNGLGPVLVHLLEQGWVTHLATNGAGIIHDWEFAYQGQSSEDVASMIDEGRFGNWEETGYYINLALNVGAYEGRGYGESVGALIHNEQLTIPAAEELEQAVRDSLHTDPQAAAAAADLLYSVQRFELKPGCMSVPHPYKQYSAQAAAFRLNIPLTGHPMIGHDIIYNHPMNHGASVGRAAQRDFLTFAQSVANIDGGVYISIGSAVMSPMIFEKSFSMAQNMAIQNGQHIDGHFILVVDLAKSTWDWSRGEPPQDNPAYYQRYNKTFSRMGGAMRYLSADNRDFLLTFCRQLDEHARR